MSKRSALDKYLQYYSNLGDREVVFRSLDGVHNAVVIPVLQERDSLFSTLASLAKNPAADLGRTLVICVVNNHPPTTSGIQAIRDNRDTLAILEGLIEKSETTATLFPELEKDYRAVLESDLRLALIDASSSGREIPAADGGVGSARKMGMDAALKILHDQQSGNGIIICLDADTLVEENYLSAIAAFFRNRDFPAASVAYAHQKPASPALLSAICRYEIFLRSYVIGLSYTGSPYAFPSIGSTISCTAQAYLSVRGMNRRAVAEDFHFLDKLAKQGPIGFIAGTTVHPAARLSTRVAFGTGRKMHYFLEEGQDEYLIHNPEIFILLRQWLDLVKFAPESAPDKMMAAAKNIHPLLGEYLAGVNFSANWVKIRKNSPDADHLLRQFDIWFDGLKTLRLIHLFEKSCLPPENMFAGLGKLMGMMGCKIPELDEKNTDIPNLQKQLAILERLRHLFPAS